MKEILRGSLPAVLHCPALAKTVAFYRNAWGFELHQYVPGVVASLRRESVIVQLLQRRSDMPAQTFACRLLVDDIERWSGGLKSASGQTPYSFSEQAWGFEAGLSDCDGNRLQLVQSAAHQVRRRAGA